ncbi:hypothetical protein ACP4OV_007316 [Aristida adscensionis]
MGATVQLAGLVGASSPAFSPSHCSSGSKKQSCSLCPPWRRQQQRSRRRLRVVRAVEVGAPGGEPSAAAPVEEEQQGEPSVDFAFVAPKLLPDGTPDVHYRTACGGQKLRDIMLDGHIDLYGPYDRLLLNCSGDGVCGTCIVEVFAFIVSSLEFRALLISYLCSGQPCNVVVAGKEMLSPKTDVEKELLKKKPKTWRLACQATVGNPESTGQMIIQQLPEWKAHEWDKQ